jgi:hypothetical protein
MDKILRVLQLLLVAVALWGCQSVQRKVVVVDSQTGAPVSGAFVYAYSYDAFDPLASHGLYLTDSNGEVAIKERCRNFAVSAGKEGYNYVKYAEPAVLEGDTLVSKLKLSPEEISGKYPVKIEMFRKFPSDNKTQSIVKQMYNYFSKRNVYMATVGEPYILEVEVYVVDADTNEPVNDAMLFVRSGSFANGHYEDIVATNSDGIAKVSVDLVSPNLRIDTGKEGYQRNAKAPLKAICILKQSKTNGIVRIEHSDAINHLMRQVYMPHNAISLSSTLALLGKMIEKTPVYELSCDISKEAFDTSFGEMTR